MFDNNPTPPFANNFAEGEMNPEMKTAKNAKDEKLNKHNSPGHISCRFAAREVSLRRQLCAVE